VDIKGPESETALQLAAAGGHHDTLRLLLQEGADVNHVDEVRNIQYRIGILHV
jgi:ankyrin repeat protein